MVAVSSAQWWKYSFVIEVVDPRVKLNLGRDLTGVDYIVGGELHVEWSLLSWFEGRSGGGREMGERSRDG